jgi:23S rRNA (cytidine2498-2'-O)-methyltransferase
VGRETGGPSPSLSSGRHCLDAAQFADVQAVQAVIAGPEPREGGARFLWFLHQPASGRWLKRELAGRRPDLRLAFSRPGLTTFKVDPARAGEPISSSFARARGWSLGRAEGVDEVLALAAGTGDAPLRLHVFERDLDQAADERDPVVVGSRARALDLALRAAAKGRFLPDPDAQIGDLVLDVITAPAEQPAESLFVGCHRHDRTHGPWPGGVPHVPIPARAPSRAWAKLEEAIRWSGLVPRAGEIAVEIGSAPGGASFALLERGLEVHGVDPGAMSPVALGYVGSRGNRFVHHPHPAAEVDARALPRRFQWLACDVNLAPMVALKYVERFVALAHGGLRGAFLTLKLNDEGVFEALPRLATRIQRLGAGAAGAAREVRWVQLPSHRSEIVAIVEW